MPLASSVAAISKCEACDEPLSAGAARCPACGQLVESGSPRLVLILAAAFIIAAFAMAQYLVSVHRQTELSLAKTWSSRGERAMAVNNPAIAAQDYRTALTYDPENQEYRLRLAEALLADNHFNEARAYLLSLWGEDPADGEVTLTLARLYAKQGAVTDAVRYYRNAINGVWKSNSREHRIDARFELIQYLLQRHDTRQAEVELIALQADAPQEEERQIQLAGLLLQIGDAARAQGVYEGVLKDDPNNVRAWLGDGKASFAMGDFPAAERELSMAVERDSSSIEAREQLDLVREVLRVSPALRGLSIAERARRVSRAFVTAISYLTGCATRQGQPLAGLADSAALVPGDGTQAGRPPVPGAPTPPSALQSLYTEALQKKANATEEALRKNPDSLEPTMDFVFKVERGLQATCPDMSITDRALQLLASRQSHTVQ